MDTAEKDSIRGEMKSRRRELSREEVLAKSDQIQNSLFSQAEFAKAKTISFYVAKQEDREVETEHMIKDCLQSDKQVLVPLVSGETKLSLCELEDYDRELEPGAFGVLEPKPSCRRVRPLEQTDLLIVPGLAFDLQGYRLGYGGEYYDSLIQDASSTRPNISTIGLAYEFQILEKLPHESHDMPVDKVITEERVIHTSSNRPDEE